MARFFRSLSIVLLLLCCPLLSMGEVVKDLFTANVKVASRNDQDFQSALPQALTQVLIKVSGNSSIATIPTISSQLNHAEQWVQSYGYVNGIDGPEAVVQFNRGPIYQLLRNAGQTIWADDRPQLLVWVQSQPYGQESNLWGQDNTYTPALLAALSQRGLAYMLPMGDLDDEAVQTALASSWPPSSDKLDSLKQRYGVEAVEAVNLIETAPDQWSGQALLWFKGHLQQWSLTGGQPSDLVLQAVNNVADALADQLSVIQAQGLRESMTLHIANVNDLQSLQTVMSRLSKLSAIDALDVQSLGSDGLVLTAEVAGGRQALLQSLGNNAAFTLQTTTDNAASDRVDLIWKG